MRLSKPKIFSLILVFCLLGVSEVGSPSQSHSFLTEAYLIFVDASGGNLISVSEIKRTVEGVLRKVPLARIDVVISCDHCSDSSQFKNISSALPGGTYIVPGAYIVEDLQMLNIGSRENIWQELQANLTNQKSMFESVSNVDNSVPEGAGNAYSNPGAKAEGVKCINDFVNGDPAQGLENLKSALDTFALRTPQSRRGIFVFTALDTVCQTRYTFWKGRQNILQGAYIRPEDSSHFYISAQSRALDTQVSLNLNYLVPVTKETRELVRLAAQYGLKLNIFQLHKITKIVAEVADQCFWNLNFDSPTDPTILARLAAATGGTFYSRVQTHAPDSLVTGIVSQMHVNAERSFSVKVKIGPTHETPPNQASLQTGANK